MSSAVLFALLFLFGVLALFIGGWLYGRRVKRGADDEAPWALAGARATVQFSPQSVAVLRQLSGEPILLKQTEEGLRVQIENRRMVPSSAFVEQGASGALGEAGVAVTRLYGVRWVVVVSPVGDDQLSVQRLA